MHFPLSVLIATLASCTPLEDRVELFDAEWCQDIEDSADPDYLGAPRNTAAKCIIDGDTFDTVACEVDHGPSERIRLMGPDTPEKEGSEKGGVKVEEDECYAVEASAFLARVLENRSIRLEFDETCIGLYGRRLAYVFITVEVDDPLREEIEQYDGLIPESDVAEKVHINEWMLRAGISDLWEGYHEGRYAESLFEARERAALAGEGGWSACDDFPNG
jgi:endonuclease YncB( thermonuclease family)